MTESVRCPNCGALVAADARWCGQCYAPLGRSTGAEPAAPPPEPDPPVDELAALRAVAEWEEAAGTASPGTAGPEDAARAAVSVRRVGEGLVWDCPTCEAENPMELSMCAKCGTPFAHALAAEERRGRPQVLPRQALIRSLLLTGLGHIALGRGADGIARLILFLWAAGLGAVMLLSPSNSGPILGVGAVFVLSALAIWATTALDAFRLASGEEAQVLQPRVLLVGTVALTLLSIGAFLAAPRVGG